MKQLNAPKQLEKKQTFEINLTLGASTDYIEYIPI